MSDKVPIIQLDAALLEACPCIAREHVKGLPPKVPVGRKKLSFIFTGREIPPPNEILKLGKLFKCT